MALGTDSATAEFIRSHLDTDLEEVAQQQQSSSSHLRPSLAPFITSDGLFNIAALPPATTATFVLQVVSVKDASLSREQRCRALLRAVDQRDGTASALAGGRAGEGGDDGGADDVTAIVDATLQAVEDQSEEAAQQQQGPLRPSGGQWRCLRLELSDGFQRVVAVEDTSARTRQQTRGAVFAPEGVALGSKLVVQVAAPDSGASPFSSSCQHGVLRLHAGNTTLLGGHVTALEVFWEAQARQYLAASTGRPSRQSNTAAVEGRGTAAAPVAAAAANSVPPSPAPPPAAAMPATHPPPPASPATPQPLRQWSAHCRAASAAALPPSASPFVTVAYITEVVSDMVINESAPSSGPPVFTFALLAQLSSPEAVERETQQPQQGGQEVGTDDHLTVDLGHAWLRQLVGMPAEDFRALSLSSAAADVARLTATVESVGQALEHFGKGRFTLVQRSTDGIVEVVHAVQER